MRGTRKRRRSSRSTRCGALAAWCCGAAVRTQRAYSYYFRNRGRREAVMAAVRNPAQESILPFAAASHVSVDSPSGFAAVQELVMPEQPGRWQVEPSQSPAQTVALSTEWLADAELVIVRTTESGPVSRTLQMEGVRIAVGGSPGGNRP